MIRGHGGNVEEAAARAGCAVSDITDMSSNINPLGPPPGLLDHLRANLARVCALPEVDAHGICAAMAGWLGLSEDRVLAGAGTTQFLYLLPRALGFADPLVVAPTYSDYEDACRMAGAAPRFHCLSPASGFLPDMAALAEDVHGAGAVFLANPNNPTGRHVPAAELADLARAFPATLFVVDESYLPFVPGHGDDTAARFALPNVLVLHSLSKMFCIPGLRVGFCLAPPEITERLAGLLPPWSVNALAQEAVQWIAQHPEAAAEHAETTREYLAGEHAAMARALDAVPGVRAVPTSATFVLLALSLGTGASLVEAGIAERVLFRDCANFRGLGPGYARISFKSAEDNRRAAGIVARWASGREA